MLRVFPEVKLLCVEIHREADALHLILPLIHLRAIAEAVAAVSEPPHTKLFPVLGVSRSFGDASTHGGEFIFAQNVEGTLDKGWTWPVASILAILKIADVNNTKMSISNEGAIQITLDSGLANYKYIIPAQAA